MRVTDNGGESFIRTFTITVTDTNEEPIIKSGVPVIVYAGETVTLDGSLLSASDPEDDDSDLSLLLKSPPSHGTLMRDNSAVVGGGVITQAQLAAGRVLFSHNGDPGTSDSFFIRAQDSEGLESEVVEIQVTVRPRMRISGRVAYADGGGIPAVTINVADAASGVTDGQGYYSLDMRYGWSGTVTPEKRGHLFDSPQRVYASVTSDQEGQDFLATLERFRISGRVTIAGAGIAGVTVTLSDGSASALTGSDGSYAFEVNWGWSGSIIPSKPGHVFSPAQIELGPVRMVQVDQDFSSQRSGVEISGRVGVGDQPLAGVEIRFSNGGGIALTDASGAYRASLPWNWSGMAVPVMDGYRFNPAVREYSELQYALADQDYQAIPPFQVAISATVKTDQAWTIRRHYVQVTVNIMNRDAGQVTNETYILARRETNGTIVEVGRMGYVELQANGWIMNDIPPSLLVEYQLVVEDVDGNRIALSNPVNLQ